MNRRKFLKRIAAVAAGAVALPAMCKSSKQTLTMGVDIAKGKSHTSYRWVQVYGPYCSGEINAAPADYLNKVSYTPQHELGAMAFTGDGRHYRYMKNCTTEQLMAEVLC